MSDTDSRTTAPLTMAWWARFRTAWNRHDEGRERLAGAGTLVFRVVGDRERSVRVHLDDGGWMTVAPAPEEAYPDIPTFSAAEDGWLRFLQGRMGAVQAVMSGTLRYEGPLAFVMRNRTSFDAFAEVAAAMDGEEER